MSDEVEKAKAAAGGEKVERTLFEKIIAREVSSFLFTITHSSTLQSCVKPYAVEIINVKFIYSEKAAQFFEISTLILTGTT